MKELAESDVKEVVQTVQEIFADYNPYSGKRIGKDDVRLRDGRPGARLARILPNSA